MNKYFLWGLFLAFQLLSAQNSNKIVLAKVDVVGNTNTSINTITALFLTSNNELWVVGYGDYGQLGNGKGQSTSTIQECCV